MSLKKIKIIIITDSPGQLCNQLWSYSPFIAQAKKINAKLLICRFDKYVHNFPNIMNEKNITFCSTRLRILARLVNKIIPQRILRMSGVGGWGPLSLIKSWDHIKPEINITDRDYIKKLFKLPCYERNARKRIGVHVRQGDYAHWRRGRYFYSFQTFAIKARELAVNLFPSSDIEFAIASNVGAEEFCKVNSNSVYYPSNSPLEDLGLLASCDVISRP